MSIKSRQVAGVTTLVVFIVAVLSAFHLATLARLSLAESQSRGDLLRHAIFQRAREVAPPAAAEANGAWIPMPRMRRYRLTAASGRCSSPAWGSRATSPTRQS